MPPTRNERESSKEWHNSLQQFWGPRNSYDLTNQLHVTEEKEKTIGTIVSEEGPAASELFAS